MAYGVFSLNPFSNSLLNIIISKGMQYRIVNKPV